MQVHLNHCKTEITVKLKNALFGKVSASNPDLKNTKFVIIYQTIEMKFKP